MHEYERERRLLRAMALLSILKTSGCSQRFVAAYLRISHSTLSHWKSAREDETRKVGVPTEHQLSQLAALVHYHAKLQHGLIVTYLQDFWSEAQESALLTFAMKALLSETAQQIELVEQHRQERAERVRRFIKEIGVEDAKALLWPTVVGAWGEDGATPDLLEAARIRADIDGKNALAALDATPAEVERAREELEAWLKEFYDKHEKRNLAKSGRKAKRERRSEHD